MLTTKQILNSDLGGSGMAEHMTFGLYSFPTDEFGRPLLINGKYNIDGSIEPLRYEGELAEAKGYAGRPRVVYMLAKHNETGAEYRLSMPALKAALEREEIGFDSFAMDLGQNVREDTNGRQFAIVHFRPFE